MADEILNGNDGTLNVRAGSLGGMSMRYHELALQRWLNKLFFVREGYPVPVVFTSPMDAFSYFQQLWADANNPFQYLFDLKDANGTPLYEPHPSPIRYPIISVYRKGWKYRQYQNFSIHRWRHINWPTVANAGTERYGPQAQGWDITKCQLGNVTTSRRPMAWDYRFQIDHFCNRPDTQAFFVEQLMQEFWRTGGTIPQTWILVPYPGWGNRLVRLYIDGDIESLTPEEPEEGKNVEYRTSFTVVVEGFDVDLYYEIYPALWEIVFRFGPVAPITLEQCFNLEKTVDIRVEGSNTTLDVRPNVPSAGTCQDVLWDIGSPEQTEIRFLSGINDTDTNFGVFTIGTTTPVYDITGTITSGGVGFVTDIALTGIGTTTTDANGSYGFTVQGGYSGVAQPLFSGGNFTPPFRTYVSVGTDIPDQNYIYLQSFITATGTDAAYMNGTFVYGSADLYVYPQAGTGFITFLSGQCLDAAVLAGTLFDYGTVGVSFNTGTLADTIIKVYGTDFSAGTVLFTTGTLFDAVELAGTLTDSGSVAVSFGVGTLYLLMVSAGSQIQESQTQVSFLSGTLA